MKIILEQGLRFTLEELKEQAESNARLVYSSSVVLQLIKIALTQRAVIEAMNADARRLAEHLKALEDF